MDCTCSFSFFKITLSLLTPYTKFSQTGLAVGCPLFMLEIDSNMGVDGSQLDDPDTKIRVELSTH